MKSYILSLHQKLQHKQIDKKKTDGILNNVKNIVFLITNEKVGEIFQHDGVTCNTS